MFIHSPRSAGERARATVTSVSFSMAVRIPWNVEQTPLFSVKARSLTARVTNSSLNSLLQLFVDQFLY